MTDDNTPILKTNRILVTLDTSARGRAALQTAVRLALNSSAELQGLFVEDEDLVRLASLPFAREVDFSSAASRELQSGSMERALRAAAEQTQSAFSRALSELNLQWTFRITRGTVAQASLAAAADVDLLVIGQQGRSPHAVSSEYFSQGPQRDKRVVAVFDGSPTSFHTLEIAKLVADRQPNAPTVLVLASDGDELEQQCVSWLRQRGIRAEVERVLNPSEQTIVDSLRKWPPRMLLINRDSKFISDSQICRLVNEFDCPLILC